MKLSGSHFPPCLSLGLLLLYPAAAAAQAEPEPPPAEASEPAAEPESEPAAEPAASIKYDKGFTAESGDGKFELKAGIRTQTRLEIVREEAADEFESHFVIPRLRLQLEGHAFGEANSYKVEFDFSNRGNPGLKDFFFDHAYRPDIHIRVGQWKKPFARHELVSDFSSEFNERAIANGLVDIGRDLGVAVHNGYDKSPEGLEWAVGVFNGQGDADRSRQTLDCDDETDPTSCVPTPPTNVPADFGPLLVARVGWNMGDVKGYTEGDMEGGPLRLGVGASYQLDLNDLEEDAAGDPLLEHGAVIDAIVKVSGFDVQGAVYLLKQGDADPELSFLGQAGYFVIPEKLQVCARYSLLPNLAVDDENTQEILGAFDIYFKGHNFKWMTDAGAIVSSADEETDLQIRTQLQAVF
jgi:Phosphate-selective porin O and P